MAQKNINIVYNVDTNSIQLARGQVEGAKAATDSLTQSTQKFSDGAAVGFKAVGVVVGDLRGELAALKNKIDETDIADKARLDSLRARYKEIQDLIRGQNEEMAKTQKATEGINQSLGSLATTIRTVLTAGLIRETISATLEMAKLAGQVDGVKRAFDRLPSATLLMADLKEKTHGTLDELTLMQKAVQAQNFKIPLEQLGTLLEFAAVKAQQTGLDINYLTDSIITGLGRGSLKILDNLQFSITELKAKTKELGSQQAAVFFLVNEQMQKMGEFVENDGTKVKQLESDFKNLGQTVATLASKSGALGQVTEVFDQIVKGATLFVRVMAAGGTESVLKFHELSKAIVEQDLITKTATDSVLKFKKAHEGNTLAVEDEIKRLDALNTASRIAIINANFQGKNGEDGQMEAEERGISIRKEQIDLLKKYRNELELGKKDESEQVGLIEAIDNKIKQLNEDLTKATSFSSIDAIKAKLKDLNIYRNALLSEGNTPGETEDQRDIREAKALAELQAIDDKAYKEQEKADAEHLKEMNEEAYNYFKSARDLREAHWKLEDKENGARYKKEEKEAQDHAQRMNRLMHFLGSQLYTNARQIANELVQNEVNQYDEKIQNLQDYYSKQEELAGTNTKRVAQLQKAEAAKQKQLEAQKKAAQKKANIEKIEIDTAANVIRSILENGGIPAGLPFGAIAAGMGLVQVALVNRFAKGVIDLKGPGTETSDSIPSLLSRGESVMTADETRNSMGILKSIRARKLNDQVLEKLTITADGITVKSDNSDVVRAIGANRVDYARQFGVLYETKEVGKNQRRIRRSKSFTT